MFLFEGLLAHKVYWVWYRFDLGNTMYLACDLWPSFLQHYLLVNAGQFTKDVDFVK